MDIQFEPPKLVLIAGPPQSGKTTLIRSLIKFYIGIDLKVIKGPITMRVSKGQRITLMECPNDLVVSLELAKCADIIITLVDGSIGFELQTFELLSVLKIHEFPKLFCVVTHLDLYKQNKQLKKLKKKIKNRFMVEVNEENKMFFFERFKNFYGNKEIQALSRFISIVVPRDSQFKKENPHLVVDRFENEDAQGEFNQDSILNITVYGYVRGRGVADNCICGLNGCG